MSQENKTMEQEIERIAHLHLKERYKDTKVLWRLISEDFRITHDDFELPCEDHMFLAIALRILDRLESIEKLLQREKRIDSEETRLRPKYYSLEGD